MSSFSICSDQIRVEGFSGSASAVGKSTLLPHLAISFGAQAIDLDDLALREPGIDAHVDRVE